MKKNIPLSLILLCHNEENTIEKEIKSYFSEIIKKIPQSELIIAEDGSTDNTRNIINKLTKKLHLVSLATPNKRGYAKSLRLALSKAEGKYVFYADAGGKHDPKDFWKLYNKREEYNLITGFKVKRQDPWYRIALGWGLNTFVNSYFKVSFTDIDCGFKLLDRKALNTILKNEWILQNNISLEIVLRAVYANLKTMEIPIKHNARKFGGSRGIPPKKIPKIVFSLLMIFPSIKSTLTQGSRGEKKDVMISGYNKLYPTGSYRTIWEGKISVVYKLPKYLKIIKEILGKKTINSILEIGCGDGEIISNLLSDPSVKIKKYIGIEVSQGGVNYAKKVLQKFKNTEVVKMDGTDLKFKDNSFDIVYAIDVMHHTSDPYKMGQEMIRVASSKVFLIESNALSLARRFAQLQKRYKEMGESSYYPWQYKSYLTNKKVKEFRIYPFLFMVPRIPESLIPLNIKISEFMEKIPLLNWQCSGVIIEVKL